MLLASSIIACIIEVKAPVESLDESRPLMPRQLSAYEHVEVTSRAQWRAWLKAHYRQTASIWLVTYKKHCGEKYLAYDDIVEEALCFGWVDSLPNKLDADRKKLLLSPRRPKSPWSKINKERVSKLIASRRMTAAALAKIKAAQQDGSWDLLNDVDALIIPHDLQAALQSAPAAETNFNGFSPSVQRQLLQWIGSAKADATRSQRIALTVEKAIDNIPANRWLKPT